MKTSLREKLSRRKRRLERRIDKRSGCVDNSGIKGTPVRYELAEKQQAISSGGIGMMMHVVKQVELRKHINSRVPVFKLYLPYDETDHVLNIAFNTLCGGTCLDHMEQRRTDEAFLDALGARRIPDPTTAGDFCRRFGYEEIQRAMKAINCSRQMVWKQQPGSFFDRATIDADGAMVETGGEKKSGIGMNHEKKWGYHPLVVSLAETREVLYLANRSGNRPSHEDAAFYLDLAIGECRKAGFRSIRLRGDTDFSQTVHLDGWHEQEVEFIFGFDAKPNLEAIAENIAENRWKTLKRRSRTSANPRATRENVKQQIVEANGYKDLVLYRESIAEFDYRPCACRRAYRMIVVRKEIECRQGQQRLFEEDQVRYFFYITNVPADQLATADVVGSANERCDQENLISQLRASHCLTAPLDTLESNWAYMVFASLAWNLKQWSGLLVRVQGNQSHRAKQEQMRQRIVRMEFATFLNALMFIPAQVIRTARQVVFRLLTWRPSVDWLFMLHDHIARPMRC